MKSSYVVRAREFANQIYPFICDCRTVDQYAEAVDNFNILFHRHVKVFSGATRVVLVTSDYVLKMDYGNRIRIFGGCESEKWAYQKVYNDGYARLFAPINSVMVKDRVFYIMPKVDRIGFDYNGYDDAMDVVSEEDADYLYENFHDLHYENYGWKDGLPVIVDYACVDR